MIKLNPDYVREETNQNRLKGVSSSVFLRGLASDKKTKPLAPKPAVRSRTRNDAKPQSSERTLETNTRSTLVEAFQNELSRIPLLTKDQEQQLVKQIFRFRQSFQRLILKEAEVIRHIADLLSKWKSKKLRLDSVCNVALSETKKRKILEPELVKAIPKLDRLANKLEKATTKQELRKLHRKIVRLVDTLQIRPKSFESAPYENPMAARVLQSYRDHCKQLTTSNLRLVAKTARMICGKSAALPDMIQEGTQGLMHAVIKFDHSRKLRFSTYAIPWIRQYIFASLTNYDRNIRIPESFRNVSNRVLRTTEAAKTKLESTTGDSDRVLQLAREMLELDPVVVSRHLQFNRPSGSIDQPNQGGTSSLSQCLLSDSDSPEEIAISKECRRLTQAAIKQSLNSRECEVLTLRYGLQDGHAKSLAEVGRLMGITRERVRQIEKPALEKLGRLKTVCAL